MKVAVIGTGYVGLTTAVCFASRGHQVRCVDIVESNHTYNEAQIAWFRAGSALNLIRETQG